MSPQNFLHGLGQVVIADASEYSATVPEGQLVSFQKRLLGGAPVSSMKGTSARHAAQREHVQLPFPAQIGMLISNSGGSCREKPENQVPTVEARQRKQRPENRRVVAGITEGFVKG